jgi:hypothetical protein
MTRLYLDSAPIIYLIENVTPFAEPLTARLAFEKHVANMQRAISS